MVREPRELKSPEEGPDSPGQAARRKPRGGNPWKVPQKIDRQRPVQGAGKGETVG